MKKTNKQLIWQIVALWVGIILIFTGLGLLPSVKNQIISQGVPELVVLIAVLLANYLWVKQKIAFKTNVALWRVLLLGIPLYIFMAMIGYVLSKNGVSNVSLAVIAGLGGGIFEEYLFRGLILVLLLRIFSHYTQGQQTWYAVLISSVLFGLMHSINISSQPLSSTILQMFSATALGLFLATLYLRSGTIILPMLFHGVWDAGTTLATGTITQGAATSGSTIVNLAISLVTFLIGAFFLRRKQLAKIDLTHFTKS